VVISAKRNEIALFCGGRGSASIIREFIRWPEIRLNLLVNAYDDGLSTGELRRFIPGMLGPSDFRKNLSYLIDLNSRGQYALLEVLEFRLPVNISSSEVSAIKSYAQSGDYPPELLPELKSCLEQLSQDVQAFLKESLRGFFDYVDRINHTPTYADCALGNLIFAGIYLMNGQDFNAATNALVAHFNPRAQLINVSKGESRVLVGLKEDGEILGCEAEVVGEQSAVPICDLFFLEQPIDEKRKAELSKFSLDYIRVLLREEEAPVNMSDESAKALENADIIVFGPGTQHSSLLPSYRIAGVGDAVRASRARIRVYIVNLDKDHDISGMNAGELVDLALQALGDPENQHGTITHILCNNAHPESGPGIVVPPSMAGGCYRNAVVVRGDFTNQALPKMHSGRAVVQTVLGLMDGGGASTGEESLDIYVDLIDRSLAVNRLIQEFQEIPWSHAFDKVRLSINRLDVGGQTLPPGTEFIRADYTEAFSEVAVLLDWLENANTDYLVTLTGDGEYRLDDILSCVRIMQNPAFGVVHGSRNQIRRQFSRSLQAAYGESKFLYSFSWLGAFVLTQLFALRFGVIFTDPLTGFRIYKRNRLPKAFIKSVIGRKLTAAGITKRLIESGIEIAEIPVSYRTFSGFTKMSWRLKRGIKNFWGIFY
jgi:2-phospho-L-lactate transferase/gluconeogenesis factor (CofD/UPF0052 family)